MNTLNPNSPMNQEQLIVYLDEAHYLMQQLTPMLGEQSMRLILVACPPRMTRHVGKWLSNSARESWRKKWSEHLFAQVTPQAKRHASQIITIVAKEPLVQLTQSLRLQYGSARILDARRPKFGVEMTPVSQDQTMTHSRWEMPAALGSLGAVMVMAVE